MFQKEWWSVDSADNWLNWIMKFDKNKSNPIDERYWLIILDLQMPELSGYDVLKQFRWVQKSNIKIIVLSNRWWIDVEEEVKKLGADAFFLKSAYQLPDLYRKIIWVFNQETLITETKKKSPSFESIDFDLGLREDLEEEKVQEDLSNPIENSQPIIEQKQPINQSNIIEKILFSEEIINIAKINSKTKTEILFPWDKKPKFLYENWTLTLFL